MEHLGKVNRCLHGNEKLPLQQIREYFLNGMPRWMQFECLRIGNQDIETIVSAIKPLEMHRASIFKNGAEKQSNLSSQNRLDTSKTNSREKQINQNYFKQKSNNNAIQECKKNSKPTMHVIGKLNNHETTLLLDTGATSSYISDSLVKKMKISKKTFET